MRGDVNHAIHVQQFRVELGSAPMRAKIEQPLHNWVGQLPVWLTCFGRAASVQQGSHQNPTNMNSSIIRVSTCRRICLGRLLGEGLQTRGWLPPAVARTGPLPLVLERCSYECVDMRNVRWVPVCMHMGGRCIVNALCVCA